MPKGGEFERFISKYLTKWLTGKEKPYKFWRQNASGALATIHIENEVLAGDIKSLDDEGKFLTDIFCIECKTGYPKTSFWQHFKNLKNFNLRDFWIQTIEETPNNKYPLLIYRRKGRSELVGINNYINNLFSALLFDLNSIRLKWNEEGIEDLILYDFRNFFNKIKPDDIKNIIGSHEI